MFLLQSRFGNANHGRYFKFGQSSQVSLCFCLSNSISSSVSIRGRLKSGFGGSGGFLLAIILAPGRLVALRRGLQSPTARASITIPRPAGFFQPAGSVKRTLGGEQKNCPANHPSDDLPDKMNFGRKSGRSASPSTTAFSIGGGLLLPPFLLSFQPSLCGLIRRK